jgi:hypothetical protein
MIPGLATAEKANGGKLPPPLAAMADEVRRATVEDFLCHPPELILVDERPVEPGGRTLDFLGESPAFRSIFGHYMRTEFSIVFTVYRLVTPLPAPQPGTACTTIR